MRKSKIAKGKKVYEIYMCPCDFQKKRVREENEKLKKEVERLSSPQMGTNQVVDEVATLRREWSEMREKIRGKQSGASCVSFFNQRCSDRDSKHWCGVVEPKSA